MNCVKYLGPHPKCKWWDDFVLHFFLCYKAGAKLFQNVPCWENNFGVISQFEVQTRVIL